VALLLLDVLNDLDFPGNSALVKAAPLFGRKYFESEKAIVNTQEFPQFM